MKRSGDLAAMPRRQSWRLALLALTLLALRPQAGLAQAEPPTYTVAVVPQFQAAEITRVWTPLLERIGQEAGIKLVLRVSKDIPLFEDELLAGKPDFAYLNPYHQLAAKQAQGYVPLVRDSKLLTGILVVRADNPIKSVQGLKGLSVAFPAPNAFGASLLIRGHLAEQDKVAITPVYAKTHTNAYRQTLVGMTAATGGLRATLEREPEEVRGALRILMETPGAAPHPLSAHPRVPLAVQQAVMNAVLKLATEPSLIPYYKDIPMPNPVKADQTRDYRPLEKFKLERYAE
jgi:phosphonate transport system substrate-binding protein